MWYPAAVRNQAVTDGGGYAAGYPWRICIHTTETGVFYPSAGSYGGWHNSYPHYTVLGGRVWQHIDTMRAARALARPAGSGPTNGARAIQIEVVGYADRPWDSTTTDTVKTLVSWLRSTHGIPAVTLPAGPVPMSARTNAPQRLSPAAWAAFTGVLGHRHVPWNSHYDPGGFDLLTLITEETFMSAEAIANLLQMVGNINHQFTIKDGQPIPGTFGEQIARIHHQTTASSGNLARAAAVKPAEVNVEELALAVAAAVAPQVEAAAAQAAGVSTVRIDRADIVDAVREAMRTAWSG